MECECLTKEISRIQTCQFFIAEVTCLRVFSRRSELDESFTVDLTSLSVKKVKIATKRERTAFKAGRILKRANNRSEET